VERYNPIWKTEFEKARNKYLELLSEIDVTIEHVGSTSVEGLMAKPVLDIDIVTKNTSDSIMVINKLQSVGYKHIGNMGIEGREVLKYEKNNTFIEWMEHHLYVCVKGNENLQNHLILRDHLEKNPDSVVQYSKLKCLLAEEYSQDIDAYVDGKTKFIVDILKSEGMETEELSRIESINKIDG